MKKIRSCFLFQREAAKRPLLFWLWNGFFLLLVEAFQEVDHGASSFPEWIVIIVAVTVAIYNVFSNKCFIFVESNNLVSIDQKAIDFQ